MTAPTSTDAPATADATDAGGTGAPDTAGQTPAANRPAGSGDTSTTDSGDSGDSTDGTRRDRTDRRSRRGDVDQSSTRADLRARDNDRDRDDTDRDRNRDQGADTDTGDGDKGAAAKKPTDWSFEELPPKAQKYIEGLRKENQTRRTEAAEAKKQQTAAEQKAADGDSRFEKAMHAFTSALGLTPEDDEPERSPEELLGEVTTKYQQTQVELAVYRAAAANDGDAEALLDSRRFIDRAHKLDPAADGFQDAVAALIAESVDKDPKLRARKAEPARTAPSGGDFGGGSGEPGDREKTIDEMRRERNKSGRSAFN